MWINSEYPNNYTGSKLLSIFELETVSRHKTDIKTIVGIVNTIRQRKAVGYHKPGDRLSINVEVLDLDRLNDDDALTLIDTWDETIPITIHAGALGIPIAHALIIIKSTYIKHSVGTMYTFYKEPISRKVKAIRMCTDPVPSLNVKYKWNDH